MGGPRVCKEPVEESLHKFPCVRPFFEQAGWMEYIRKLHGYDDDIALECSIHYREGIPKVAGTVVHVIEEVIVEVTGLPQTKEQWFSPQKLQLDIFHKFLEAGEHIQKIST